MTEPGPLISNELGMAIIGAIGAVGAGVVAFLRSAFNAWLADRKEEREERAKDRGELTEMKLEVRSLVIQSQRRDDRRRQTEQPPNRRVPRDEFAPEETTDIVEIQRELRGQPVQRKPATPAFGIKRLNTRAEDR